MTMEFHVAPPVQETQKTNAIMERVHQTNGNIIRAFKAQNIDLDEKKP